MISDLLLFLCHPVAPYVILENVLAAKSSIDDDGEEDEIQKIKAYNLRMERVSDRPVRPENTCQSSASALAKDAEDKLIG